MKTNKIKLSTLLVAGAMIAFTSCKKDEATDVLDITPATAAQADAAITGTSDALASDINELANLESASALSSVISELSSNNNFRKSNAKETFNPEPFAKYYGWSFSVKKGETLVQAFLSAKPKTDKTSVDITFIPDSGKKPVTLNIADFVLVQITTEKDGQPNTDELPVKIKASAVIEGKTVSTVTFDAEWNEQAMPISLNASITLEYFKLAGSYTELGLTNTANVSLTKNTTTTIAAAGVKLTFGGTPKTGDNIDFASGYVQLKDIKLDGSVNVKGLKAVENPTVADLHANIIVTLSNASTGQTLAKLKAKEVVKDGQTDIEPVFEFADGTTKPASAVAEKLMKSVGDAIGKIAPPETDQPVQ